MGDLLRLAHVRILHLNNRLSTRGGADWHLLGVLDSLRRDHALHLAVGQVDGTAESPCPVSVHPVLAARERQAADLDELVEDARPEIVHLHNIVNPAVLEWAARRPAIMTVQDHRAFCPGRGKWKADGTRCAETMSDLACSGCFADTIYFGDMLALTRSRLAAMRELRLTVLSRYMKRELVAVGVPAARISVIPPFVHGLEPADEPGGPPCVLFVGRVVAAKGVLDAVAAWQRSGVDLPLVLAGTGSERQAVKAAGGKVTGWLSHAELARLYRRAAVVLLPSRWQEPFGIVGLEALSFGVPVAAFDSGGVSDWHPGDFLVPWGDIDGLARAIQSAIGRRAHHPPGFERDVLMQQLVDLYCAHL